MIIKNKSNKTIIKTKNKRYIDKTYFNIIFFIILVSKIIYKKIIKNYN